MPRQLLAVSIPIYHIYKFSLMFTHPNQPNTGILSKNNCARIKSDQWRKNLFENIVILFGVSCGADETLILKDVIT